MTIETETIAVSTWQVVGVAGILLLAGVLLYSRLQQRQGE
jgi:hypothetical protein